MSTQPTDKPTETTPAPAAPAEPFFARFLEKQPAPVRTGLRAGARKPSRSA